MYIIIHAHERYKNRRPLAARYSSFKWNQFLILLPFHVDIHILFLAKNLECLFMYFRNFMIWNAAHVAQKLAAFILFFISHSSVYTVMYCTTFFFLFFYFFIIKLCAKFHKIWIWLLLKHGLYPVIVLVFFRALCLLLWASSFYRQHTVLTKFNR